MNDFWELLESLMPSDIEMNKSDGYVTFTDGQNEVRVVMVEENKFQINGKSYAFEDTDYEIINTILIPCILQELDGERRL